jgi:hypothetical protein
MNAYPEGIINILSSEFNLSPAKLEPDELMIQLEQAIDKLLETDFPRLINILYRLDVDENKLKEELKNKPGVNASLLIAKLVVERQMKKLESRKQFESKDEIPDDEKW